MRTLLHAPRTRKRSIAAATLGALALVGSLLVATPAQAINDTGTGGVFVPASGRVLDTKVGTGGFSTPMEAGKYRTIKIAGVAGIPDDATVGAVSLNATVSGSADNGILYGRPDADTSRTTMLIYNDNAGEYVSNTAIVAVSTDGTIQVSTETAARLILDVQGYYTANTDGTAAGGFVPVAGKRIVDTRSGLGAPKALLAPGKSVDIQVTGANGVPAGASGAVVNLLPINSTASDGYLTPYATGTTRPDNALHYAPSVNTSIQAQVRLSSSGKMTIYNGSSTINLVIDLQGYFTKAGVNGATFTPGIGRVFDSRATGNTILAKNETRAIQVTGQAGVPVMGSGITAVVLTLTAAHGGSDGRASVWANGTTQPDTTSINFQTDEIRTNTVTVALGANGKINLNNVADATNYVIDLQGWYTNPVAPTIACPNPYTSGSWATEIPATDITCTVTSSAATSSGEQLTVTLDGDLDSINDLSDTSTTVTTVAVPAQGGVHTIAVEIDDSQGNAVATNTSSFGLGNWAAKPLVPTPADAAEADTAGSLEAAPTGDAFGPDAQFRYTITSDPDGARNPVVVSDWVSGAFPIPATALTAGATYYWTVTARGSSGGSSTIKTVQSPVWSFIASAAPKATIACPAPYQDGSWQHDALSSAVNCTVTAPSAYTDGANLSLTVDGADAGSQPLSAETPTTATVTIPAGASAHSIVARTSIENTNASTETTHWFGTGLWSDGNYVPSLADGGSSNDITPVLFTDSDGAPFGEKVQLQYTVGTRPDGSGVVAQSDWSAQPLTIADGTLTEGQTYYWHAEAKGPLNDGSGNADTVSPVWSFVATADPDLSDPTTAEPSTVRVAAASSCPAWLFIGVRGTTAGKGSGKSKWGSGWTKGGFGATELLSQKLKRHVGGITVESLNYPATWSPIGGSSYWNSKSRGQTALIKEMNAVAKSCSSTKMWVAGHSQGAQVVGDTLASGKLSKKAKANFRGAVLGGDPTYVPKEKVDAPGNGPGYGTIHGWHHSVDSLTAKNNKGKKVQQVRSWCYDKDMFCQGDLSLPVHNSYSLEPTAIKQEKWLRQFA